MASEQKNSVFTVLFIVIIPLIFFCIGSWMFVDQYTIYTQGIKTEGVFTGYRKSYDSEDNSITYCPQAKFKDIEGRLIDYDSRVCSSSRPFTRGQSVPIYYLPENPYDKSRIITGWKDWILPSVFMGVGGLFLFFILMGMLAPKNKKPYRQGIYDIIKRSEELKREHDDEFHGDTYDKETKITDKDQKTGYGKRRGL